MEGAKRIKAIERDIGRQVVGRAWINVLERRRKTISRKDFNKIINRTLHFSSSDADQILDVLRRNGKVKVKHHKINLLK